MGRMYIFQTKYETLRELENTLMLQLYSAKSVLCWKNAHPVSVIDFCHQSDVAPLIPTLPQSEYQILKLKFLHFPTSIWLSVNSRTLQVVLKYEEWMSSSKGNQKAALLIKFGRDFTPPTKQIFEILAVECFIYSVHDKL